MKSSTIFLLGLLIAGFFIFFHPIPSCGLFYNFFIAQGCVSPITIFGLDPNLIFAIVVVVSTTAYSVTRKG